MRPSYWAVGECRLAEVFIWLLATQALFMLGNIFIVLFVFGMSLTLRDKYTLQRKDGTIIW